MVKHAKIRRQRVGGYIADFLNANYSLYVQKRAVGATNCNNVSKIKYYLVKSTKQCISFMKKVLIFLK